MVSTTEREKVKFSLSVLKTFGVSCQSFIAKSLSHVSVVEVFD